MSWGFSGFAFSGTYYDNWRTNTAVGSRFCFLNKEVAVKTANENMEIFKEFLTIKK